MSPGIICWIDYLDYALVKVSMGFRSRYENMIRECYACDGFQHRRIGSVNDIDNIRFAGRCFTLGLKWNSKEYT